MFQFLIIIIIIIIQNPGVRPKNSPPTRSKSCWGGGDDCDAVQVECLLSCGL
jgi:hypothetical protein